ncbi:MAG TPA: SRPBCC family protein [Steroidobacteraceae bacterium]
MGSTDRIERKILLRATRARVWRALSDAKEFGDWFGVDFKGKSFEAGKSVKGQITYPGYEHIVMEVMIDRVIPERLLSWHWHPAAIDPAVDYSQEPTTLVVFELHEGEGGVLLSVIESGLDKIPSHRRATVFRLNSSGWDEQVRNIEKHVAAP